MNLTPFKVTKKKNVKSFDTETGVFDLHDDAAVGLAVAEHLVPFSQVVKKTDPVTGEVRDELQSGMSELLTVLWSHLRHPAIRHEAPAELVWLEIEKNEDSRLEEEPYSSVEHIMELAEEGDFEAKQLLDGIRAFSDAKLKEEGEEEEEEEEEEELYDDGLEEDDGPEISA